MMKNTVIEIINKHNLIVPDVNEAILKASELFNDNLTLEGMSFTDKLSSAVAGIYITYVPILWRVEDVHIESNSCVLKEGIYDDILLSYLSPQQQDIAKYYVMTEYYKTIHGALITGGFADENSYFQLYKAITPNGQTRYKMEIINRL